ncbi:hypothetical protein [Azospirillum sp.]|uniref:hypothetical protein n=1 Tax=Azospirillum sp. TaxID=34012 RepID=UPI002D517BF3|nr:hypothetical protein [Azospirillum sp.]HYD70579.1 hypothetical protein [Azospirillum sp.]
MKRILIASPVRKPPHILAEHLRSLERLDCGGVEVAYLFLDDNDDRESYGFPLFDMWSGTHYCDDAQWTAHTRHFPFLVRYTPDFQYSWTNARIHGGRFPSNAAELPAAASGLRIRHYGWSRPADRIAKHERYRDIDPDYRFSDRAQMDSILDPLPNLVRWCDE